MNAKIFAANWKLFKNPVQTRDYFKFFLSEASWQEQENAIFFVPALVAESASESLNNSPSGLGLQNVWWQAEGAFTGENSAVAAKGLGFRYALVGHSERRTLFGESDDLVHKKIKFLLEQGVVPMLCVGESLAEREAGKTEEVLERQIKSAMKGLAASCLLAYEPVWAIGTGRVASPDIIEKAHAFIAGLVRELAELSENSAGNPRVLYGGSVKPENASEILKIPGVDGLLVGGASLDGPSFLKIMRSR